MGAQSWLQVEVVTSANDSRFSKYPPGFRSFLRAKGIGSRPPESDSKAVAWEAVGKVCRIFSEEGYEAAIVEDTPGGYRLRFPVASRLDGEACAAIDSLTSRLNRNCGAQPVRIQVTRL